MAGRELCHISPPKASADVVFIQDGTLVIDDRWDVSAALLDPEHAYYLAAQLTKWADAQEEKI